MAGSDIDSTKATAHLPGLDIEIVHRQSPDGLTERISINLTAVPSFEAFAGSLNAMNPFFLWAEAMRLAWLPWAEATRAAMNGHDDLFLLEAETCGDLLVEDLGNSLNLKVVITRAQCAHLASLTFLRPIGHTCGFRAGHLAMLLNALQIAHPAPAALDRPTRAAPKHGIHFKGVERDCPLAAKAGGNLLVEGIGKLLLHRLDVRDFEVGEHRAHPARDIETNSSG